MTVSIKWKGSQEGMRSGKLFKEKRVLIKSPICDC